MEKSKLLYIIERIEELRRAQGGRLSSAQAKRAVAVKRRLRRLEYGGQNG